MHRRTLHLISVTIPLHTKHWVVVMEHLTARIKAGRVAMLRVAQRAHHLPILRAVRPATTRPGVRWMSVRLRMHLQVRAI